MRGKGEAVAKRLGFEFPLKPSYSWMAQLDALQAWWEDSPPSSGGDSFIFP